MIRGLGTPGISGNRSWFDMARLFEHEGFFDIKQMQSLNLKCYADRPGF